MIEFTPWPEAEATEYRQRGYWLDQPLTTVLTRQLEKNPTADAIICGQRHFRYTDLDRLSTNLAKYLVNRGIAAVDGSPVTALVQLPNVAEFYLVFFALLKIGVVPVNALYSHQYHELKAYVDQIEPALIIADAKHSLFRENGHAAVKNLISDVPHKVHWLFMGADDAEINLQSALANGHADIPFSPRPTPADQVAFFQLSGGSTGTPKLIPRTHNDYYYSVRCSADICQLNEQVRYLCALPAAHNFPLSSPGALGIFYSGGCVVMAKDPEPQHCFALIREHHVTMVALVPSAVSVWLQAAPSRRPDLQSLRLIQVGGASFAESLARRVPKELGCQLQQVFGMAEGLVNYTRLDDDDEVIFTTQGRPMSPADKIRVLTEAGEEATLGQIGRLLTRGPYTFRGYYRAAEHSAAVFDGDGFYTTGDLVQITGEGNFRVVGRIKDQVNRGGEKIAAEEIESLLLTHAKVKSAALIAVTDAALGEKSCACIVATDSQLNAVSLRKYLRSLQVADYKIPDKIIFLESLPLTAVGKIDKNQLRTWLGLSR